MRDRFVAWHPDATANTPDGVDNNGSHLGTIPVHCLGDDGAAGILVSLQVGGMLPLGREEICLGDRVRGFELRATRVGSS